MSWGYFSANLHACTPVIEAAAASLNTSGEKHINIDITKVTCIFTWNTRPRNKSELKSVIFTV